ncbi:DUF4810 domain-containing protein [Microvirgula curvata]|uniref:DUF4810 domain-containing protein n=1 Tax=Microvirgula aerodenitrificans TaxID=57480 RepID=A0A2S0P888_9NEIS|nr:DUF4810 domain-containing protein [Microvirgula aerodenitrificans]AVY93545.1 DUF4810 domain-containing protein [Microvirgula aerodenitrificans]
MIHRHLLLPLLAALMLAGCAAQRDKYTWGEYESSLYSYYKNPENAAALTLALQKTIEGAEKGKLPPAPGLYAEYGYLLMQQGKKQEAIAAFEKEKQRWPESGKLMDNMIKAASAGKKPASQESAS